MVPMKPLSSTVLLALACSCGTAALTFGHGGPQPPQPPGNPTPGGPGGPHIPVPTGGSPTGPSAPTGGQGTGSPTPGPITGGARPSGAGPQTGPIALGSMGSTGESVTSSTSWEQWWFFNKDGYLKLRERIDAGEVETTSDAFLNQGSIPSREALTLSHVVPALLQTLEKDRQQDVVSSSLIALARMSDGVVRQRSGEFADRITPLIADPNQEISETSVVALGLIRHDRSVVGMSELLLDSELGHQLVGRKRVNERTRAFAAYALGLAADASQIEDEKHYIVQTLATALDSESHATPDVHAACVISLGLAPLAFAGLDPETLKSKRAADAPVDSREDQIEKLVECLRDGKRHKQVRAHVPDALARLCADAPKDWRERVAGILADVVEAGAREKDEVVQGAILALGRLGDADRDTTDIKIRAVLRRAAEGSDIQSRLFALISLAQIVGRVGNGEGVGTTALEAQSLLLQRLVQGKQRERNWSALSLGVMEYGRAQMGAEPSITVRSTLRRSLQEARSAEEVGALAVALGLCGDREAVPIMIWKLEQQDDWTARGHLAIALGLIGDEKALPALRELLQASRLRPELLRECAVGLTLLGDRSCVNTLIETLKEARSMASQASAAQALGYIGDSRSVAPLLEMLQKQELTASARGFAASALGIVCDRDRAPWNARVSQGLNYRAATTSLLDDNNAGLLNML
jgi:HEAT repeat protein